MKNSHPCTQKINEEPLVSVCIPVYNHENYVHSCIKSVIDQDYKNIELIIIDDGSSDNSRERIEELTPQCRDRFVRFEFRSRPNKGLCATLNEALEWCQGQYFSAVASDDIWLEQKTSSQIKEFTKIENQELNLGVISGETIGITEKGHALPTPKYRPPPLTLYNFNDIYTRKSRISAPTAMIKMEAIRKTGGYNPKIIIEDWFMWLSIARLGYKILATDQYYAKYRTHNDNTYKKIEKMHLAKEAILSHFAEDKESLKSNLNELSNSTYKAAAIYQKSYAIKLIKTGKVNPLTAKNIKPTLLIPIPSRVIFYIINKYREVRKYGIGKPEHNT